MKKRARIRIRGNVQMAGFRTFIKNVADSLFVTGFAENDKDGSVKVVCEGEGEAIESLIHAVKQNSPSFVRIEEVKAAYEDYKGEFISFERRGADVPGEGESEMVALMRSFDKKGEVMISILSSMNETLKDVKEDTGKMLEKQDLMLDKQDLMLDKQDETISELKGVRDDLKSYMEERFERIEREIADIKSKIGVY